MGIRERIEKLKAKELLKKIFTKPPKAVVPEPDIPQELTSNSPLFEENGGIILPRVIVPKTGFLDKIRAMRPIVMLREKKVKEETGLTTRQRVKRYDASMEGGYGTPEASRKRP